MGRKPCCSRVGLNRGSWTSHEDQLLRDFIEVHGEGQWTSLPLKAGLKRCGKSCRLRWLNYLKPDIKRGNITEDEQDLIIRLHKLLGNRWSLIAGRLPGRTDNEVKNYWNTTLARKVQVGTQSSSAGSKPQLKQQIQQSKGKKLSMKQQPVKDQSHSSSSNAVQTKPSNIFLNPTPTHFQDKADVSITTEGQGLMPSESHDGILSFSHSGNEYFSDFGMSFDGAGELCCFSEFLINSDFPLLFMDGE